MDKKSVMTDEKCSRCDGPMVRHPDHAGLYCGSWEYMEGGCPPPPNPVDAEKDRLHRALSDIWSIGFDYDGWGGNAEKLEELIDEIVNITNKARGGEEWWKEQDASSDAG